MIMNAGGIFTIEKLMNEYSSEEQCRAVFSACLVSKNKVHSSNLVIAPS